MKLRDWIEAIVLFFVVFVITLVIASYSMPVRSQEVEYLPAPGIDEPIPMPPEAMRLTLTRLIDAGKGPLPVYLSGSELSDRCRREGIYLLGCATPTACRLGIVFIREALHPKLERMAHVHEFAHCKGWKHP